MAGDHVWTTLGFVSVLIITTTLEKKVTFAFRHDNTHVYGIDNARAKFVSGDDTRLFGRAFGARLHRLDEINNVVTVFRCNGCVAVTSKEIHTYA